MKAKEQA
jgi:hypothetical protein